MLPVEEYFLGVDLPPHLSPFVQEEEGDYIPPERQAILDEEKTKENVEEKEEGGMFVLCCCCCCCCLFDMGYLSSLPFPLC